MYIYIYIRVYIYIYSLYIYEYIFFKTALLCHMAQETENINTLKDPKGTSMHTFGHTDGTVR